MQARYVTIRNWLILPGLLALLAGCDLPDRSPPRDVSPRPGLSISGTAVMGVAGGSGKSTRMVSGIRDLKLTLGATLED